MHSMNGSSVPRHCADLEVELPTNECPASELNFIQNWLSMSRHSLPDEIKSEFPSLLGRVVQPPDEIQLTGRTSTRQYKADNNRYSGYLSATTTVSTTQHAGIADALTSIGALWSEVISLTQIGVRHGASFFDE